MATLSESYGTAARKMSSFYDKALAEAGLGVAQYSILAAVERRVDEPPIMKATGGGPRHGSIDSWAEPSSTGTRGIITMIPSNGDARSKQISLSALGYNSRDVTIALAMN
jgi:hypothetical protein